MTTRRRDRNRVLHTTLASLCPAACPGLLQARATATTAAATTAAARTVPHVLSASDLETFNSRGWLRTPPLLTPTGLAALRREAMSAWAAEKRGIDQTADGLTWLQAALLPNIHRASEAARQWYWRGPVVGLAAQLIGPNVKSSGSQLSFKLRGNTQEFQFHQDNQCVCAAALYCMSV